MFEYIKDKFKKVSNNVDVKDNVANGIGSIGYIDLNSSVSVDLSATLLLAELDNSGKSLPLLLTDYIQKGSIKKIMKQSFNDFSYSLRCFFDSDLENFIQINVIDSNIDSASIFKRYDRIFYNKSKELFIDKNGDEYSEDLWSNVIIGDTTFFIISNDTKIEYDRVFSSKEIYSSNIKSSSYTVFANIEECFYHRGIESNEINRELVLVSHLETNSEKSINIYIGLDISLASLKVI